MYQGTAVDNNTPTPPLSKPSIALVKTAAVGGTGKVMMSLRILCCNWKHNPY
jgi:hypothetical protein